MATGTPVTSRLVSPLICLVTDRRRLAGSDPETFEAVVSQVAAAARAGVDLVQIREHDLEARDLLALVRQCVEAVRGTGARVVVNDRLDVALAAGAHGVHLRAQSFAPWRARALAQPPFLVGRSVHDVAEGLDAARGGQADYLVAGTVFESASKPPGQATLGLEALGRLARGAGVPVLGIGGMTEDRLAAVCRAGAAGIAAIGLFLPAGGDDPGRAASAAARRARAALESAAAARSDTLGLD